MHAVLLLQVCAWGCDLLQSSAFSLDLDSNQSFGGLKLVSPGKMSLRSALYSGTSCDTHFGAFMSLASQWNQQLDNVLYFQLCPAKATNLEPDIRAHCSLIEQSIVDGTHQQDLLWHVGLLAVEQCDCVRFTRTCLFAYVQNTSTNDVDVAWIRNLAATASNNSTYKSFQCTKSGII